MNPTHNPKLAYNKCNVGHELVEVYDEKRNAYVWDCPTCIRKMRFMQQVEKLKRMGLSPMEAISGAQAMEERGE